MDWLPLLLLFALGLSVGALGYAAWIALSWLAVPAGIISLFAFAVTFFNSELFFARSRPHYTSSELVMVLGIVLGGAVLGCALSAANAVRSRHDVQQ